MRRRALLGVTPAAALAARAPAPVGAQPYLSLADALAGFDALHQAAVNDPALWQSREWQVEVVDVLASALEAARVNGDHSVLEEVRLFAIDYTEGIAYGDDFLVMRALLTRARLGGAVAGRSAPVGGSSRLDGPALS